MDRLRAHWRHLLGRLSPRVDPGPDSVLFVLQCLRVLVAAALDAFVTVLEDHTVFLEQLDPYVVELFVVFHFLKQGFEVCLVDLADVVLIKTNPMVSSTA